MKKLLLLLLAFISLSAAEAASSKRDKIVQKKMQEKKLKDSMSSVRWHTDLSAALKEAKRGNKQILLLVTGSDWCPPCKNLEKKIFSQKSFIESSHSVVLLKADFPRKRKQSDAEKKQARLITQKYRISGYPTVFLLDSNGKILDKKVGFSSGTPKSYLKKFKGFKPVKLKKQKGKK